MKRTISLLTTLVTFATTANASFYVGPKIGASFNVGRLVMADQNSKENISYAGAGAAFLGGLNFGYDYVTDSQMYFAIDSSLLLNTLSNDVVTEKSNAGDTFAVFLKTKFNYAIAMQLGYKLENNVIPYVSLGGYGGKYTVSIENNNSGLYAGLNGYTTKTIKKTIFALNPGLGFKYPVSENFLVTMQYDYVIGGKLSKTFTDSESIKSWNYKTRINQHNVALALLYKF